MPSTSQIMRRDASIYGIAGLLLPEAYDPALKGLAERPQTRLLPVYDWQEFMRISGRERDGLSRHWQTAPQVWLWPPDKPSFWSEVERKHLMAWEGMHGAILGVTWQADIGKTSAYSVSAFVEQLVRHEEHSQTLPVGERWNYAQDYFERNIASAWLGETTPFYITTTFE